jgi:hypothetical protein
LRKVASEARAYFRGCNINGGARGTSRVAGEFAPVAGARLSRLDAQPIRHRPAGRARHDARRERDHRAIASECECPVVEFDPETHQRTCMLRITR